MSAQTPRWRVMGNPHVRASAHANCSPPGWPDLAQGDLDTWPVWLRAVWEQREVAAAIRHASPVLASRAEALVRGEPFRLPRARRVVAAVLRYVLRAQHRPTPFGLFAGVTTGRWGERSAANWNGHRLFAAPAGDWVAEAVSRLEASPDLLNHTEVVANSAATVVHDDGQLLIPQVARPEPGHPLATTTEIRLRYTSAVQVAVEAARCPTPWSAVLAAVCTAHPDETAENVGAMLAQLVWAGALITNLRPPSTAAPLVHLETTLRAMGPGGATAAQDTARAHEALLKHNATSHDLRMVEEAMSALSHVSPIGVDLRLDADVTLPHAVARAAEEAMGMLEVLSPHRGGLESWRGWRERFTDRYGTGSLVPVTEAVASTGVGYPTWSERPAPTVTNRDRWLLERAQAAALDHAVEVDAGDLLALMRDEEHAPAVGHTEINARLESPSPAALDSGRFRLAVLGVSRTAATMAGRFATMTSSQDQLSAALTSSSGPLSVQLSFSPEKARSAYVARVPQLLDHVLCVAEHPGPGMLDVDDIALGCDDEGLFLWSRTLGSRIHPVVPHALNLRYAPVLVRFLAELPRAERMPASDFSWGVADRLPFLPRLRSGRIVLSPARWRVRPGDLPPARAEWPRWEQAWSDFANRRRVPTAVELGGGDQRLRLDLSEPDHRYLLRTHLNTTGTATLREAPDPRSLGWCHGRPHEILLQLITRSQGEA